MIDILPVVCNRGTGAHVQRVAIVMQQRTNKHVIHILIRTNYNYMRV